jgi:Lipopolysaccharide-assembly
MRRCLACAALLALGAGACGYRFTAAGGDLPGQVRALYVPLFRNQTAEPEVEATFTAALRQELARAGREGGEAAEARAEGTITQVTYETSVQTSFPVQDGLARPARISAYRVRAIAVVRVFRGTQKLAEVPVNGTEDYAPGGDCAVPSSEVPARYTSANAGCVLELEANRRVALRRLAATLMRQAYQSLASGF